MDPVLKRIKTYVTPTGKDVFQDWFKGLKEKKTQAIVFSRIDRLAMRNPGDCKPVGHGVTELRIHFGPGYRVYYAEEGKEIILLLCGGDKSTQQRDIEKALSYWDDYRRRP